MGRPKKVVDEVQAPEELLVEQEKLNKELVPSYNSAEWSDYVMTQFTENELVDGHPNINGLRRVAENLLGPFIESGPVEVKSSLDGDSIGRAYCIYQIVVYPFMKWGDQPTVTDGYEKRVYRATADAYKGNLDAKFALYTTAMAETRSEARCLRKMLKLREVAIEELTANSGQVALEKEESTKIANDFDEDDQISTSQIFVIRRKCSDLNIDVMKLINSGEKQYEKLEDLNKGTGKAVVTRLSQYQTNSIEIPKEFVLGG